MFVISETQGHVNAVYKNKGDWFEEGELIAKVDDELLRAELEATQATLPNCAPTVNGSAASSKAKRSLKPKPKTSTWAFWPPKPKKKP